MEFGEIVTNWRRRAQLTQKQLAEKVEISTQYLNQIERGRPLDSIGKEIVSKIESVLSIPNNHTDKLKQAESDYPFKNNQDSAIIKLLEIEKENCLKTELMLNDIIKRQDNIIKRQDERIAELVDHVKFYKNILEEKTH